MHLITVEKPGFKKNPVDHHHFIELRRQVLDCLRKLPARRLVIARIRAVLLIVFYFTLYVFAIFQQDTLWLFYLIYALMGFTAVLIFLNVVHETCHGNLFSAGFLNRMFYRVFDLLGMNSFIWQKRHNLLHHNYPNVAGWDSDIEQSGPIKIYPHDSPDSIQRHQHIFFVFLYPLFLVNWVVLRDFKDYLMRERIVKKVCRIPFAEWLKLIFFKCLFAFYILFIPWYFFGHPFGQVIMATIIMLCCAGIFALSVLLTPHVNTGNEFPLIDAQNDLENSWFIHQLISTNDLSIENFITRHLMGNFNYHVAHHLFPNISCVYAPEVTEVIRAYAKEHQLPYRTYSFFEALKKHYELLKQNALALKKRQTHEA